MLLCNWGMWTWCKMWRETSVNCIHIFDMCACRGTLFVWQPTSLYHWDCFVWQEVTQPQALFQLAMIWCQPISFQCIAVNIMFLLITFKEVTGRVLLWLEDTSHLTDAVCCTSEYCVLNEPMGCDWRQFRQNDVPIIIFASPLWLSILAHVLPVGALWR
jgi:hypothetical protein